MSDNKDEVYQHPELSDVKEPEHVVTAEEGIHLGGSIDPNMTQDPEKIDDSVEVTGNASHNRFEFVAEQLTHLRRTYKECSSKNKRIIWLLAAVLAFILLGSMFGKGGTVPGKDAKNKVAQVSAMLPANKQPNTKPTVVKNATPATNQRPFSESQLNTDKKITAISGAIQGNQAEISGISAKMDRLNKLMLIMAQQEADMKNQLQQQKASLQDKEKASSKQPLDLVVPITYTLKAVESGRAWLQSSRGQSLTVKVGDMLPQYGRVDNIDDQVGSVDTSSGKVIEYTDDNS